MNESRSETELTHVINKDFKSTIRKGVKGPKTTPPVGEFEARANLPGGLASQDLARMLEAGVRLRNAQGKQRAETLRARQMRSGQNLEKR